ncbi:MAG: ATP-binding cassette domain-containing protein, partial [Bacteroidota bacterium]
GKTTFAELLSKVLIPEQGKITFCLPEEQMMDQDNIVKLVRQDAHIFDDTIMNNILMANKGLTDQQIVSLINEYEVQSILSPSRLQEHIGELGEKLSGGQRQVISILRGIIANPPVLIFDELSNNLPIDLAERIIRKLAKQRADKATILISHRRLNLNYASQINLAK